MSWRDDYGYFRPSRPREAKGGIKAQSGRGGFGKSWWARRWVAVLESFNVGARLTRGRSYARNGQVLDVDISRGQIKAKVQGSSPTPYRVGIQLTPLSAGEWAKVITAFAGQAIFAAKLLAGEMPQDVERVFDAAGVPLFPRKLSELHTDCSCPDPSNPCKHIAAVYYLIGEEFDRDPFLLFKLRGLTRDELLHRLNQAGASSAQGGDQGAAAAAPPRRRAAAKKPSAPREPLAPAGPPFWSGGDVPGDFFGDVRPPPVPAALPRRLGNFPFWRGRSAFLDALAGAGARASRAGMDAFVGQPAGQTD